MLRNNQIIHYFIGILWFFIWSLLIPVSFSIYTQTTDETTHSLVEFDVHRKLEKKIHPDLHPPINYSIDILWNIGKMQTNYVLDAVKIPHSRLNPSMIVDPTNSSRIIMIWRIMDKGHHDKVGYHWIDRMTFQVIKAPDFALLLLKIVLLYDIEYIEHPHESRHYLIAEDARLYLSNGRMRLIYNTHLSKYKRVYRTDLRYNKLNDMFYAPDGLIHISIDHEFGERHQKNWTPFEYCPGCIFDHGIVSLSFLQNLRNTLHKPNYDASLELYIYSIIPHRIIYSIPSHDDPTLREELAYTASLTKLLPKHKWEWGEMRGGSPALRLNDSHYLTFFHSSGRYHQQWTISYYMGAYLFESKPPFAITHMSTNPIVAPNMINESLGWAYKVVDVIVFPMAFILDESYINVSYGHNDKDGWILTLNRSSFLQSLEPVESEVLGDSLWDGNDRVIPNSFRMVNNSGNHNNIHNHNNNHNNRYGHHNRHGNHSHGQGNR